MMELEYMPGIGFRIGAHKFTWGMPRESARQQLDMTHEADDQITDLTKHFSDGEKHTIEIRRDIYTNHGGGKSSFFLGYDTEERLMDIEVHAGMRIHVGAVAFEFDEPLEQILARLSAAGYAHRLDDEGAVFAKEKFNLSDNVMMGGDGHGLAYFYAAADISHLLEDI
jgi:hypothetical protein